MAKGFFDVLQDENSSDDDDSSTSSKSDQSSQSISAHKKPNVIVPSFEDLSLCRSDEETALLAIYGDEDFTKKQKGSSTHLYLNVRPPDTVQSHVGTQLTLGIKVPKQYPYVEPAIQLKKVVGLSKDEQGELLNQLTSRAKQLAQIGSVMMVELVQLTEDYLLEHNRDPTMSAWEQMKAREAMEKEKERRLEELQQEEINRLLNRSSSPVSSFKSITGEHSDHSGKSQILKGGGDGGAAASSDIKRELHRQMEALEEARRRKQQNQLGGGGGGPANAATGAEDTGQIDPADLDDDYSDDQSDDDHDGDDPVLDNTQWGRIFPV
jgi:ubiquitin-protein ligase